MCSSPPPALTAPEPMNIPATAKNWPLSTTSVDGPGMGCRVAGFGLGTAFTLGLFLGIAYYERGAPERPAPALDDLRIARAVMEPPPVPVKPVDPEPELTPMAGFELSPAESPVKIAVSPPDLASLLPEDLSKAPPANAQLGPMLAIFKPKMDFLQDAQHIYQKSEVDRPPTALEKPVSYVSSRVRDNAAALRVTLIVVIDADGSAGHIRLTKGSGNPEFDTLMIESIKTWVFSPAMKGGKKVRCLIEQGITVQWAAGSHFGV